MEHLALLEALVLPHQQGEAFFADEKRKLPWRRTVRGVSGVFRGKSPPAALK